MIQVHSQATFQLGEIQVSAAHNSLSLGDTTLKLQPKAMAVLHYLAIHQSRVISAQELMEQLWAGRIVTQGSVQKSINAIRHALVELQPGQEFIAFYSKRGYQLQVPVTFNESPTPAQTATAPANRRLSTYRYAWALAPLIAGIILWQIFAPMSKHHKTQFTHQANYTQEKGHERSPTPHPDNEHMAYITENFINEAGDTESHLLIRDGKGQDWQLATTQGSWFKLAWSPSGQHLAAVEVKRIEGLSLKPNFFEKANFIYSFHIFTLDLPHHRVTEKQTLSQWQGRISSLNWWDNDTLEILAKQGPNAGNARYRYSRITQQLKRLDDIAGMPNPSASCIQDGITAIASQYGNSTDIAFLNAAQTITKRYTLDYPINDISWIPDGSGVLAFSDEKQSLELLYRDGKRLPIVTSTHHDHLISRPKFGPKGDKIYFTEAERNADILQLDKNNHYTPITHNEFLNYGARYSPNGEQIVYVSVRNNQIHLWLNTNGQEQQLTQKPLTERPGQISWSNNGKYLFFNQGNSLYQLSLGNQTLVLLQQSDDKVDVIGSPSDNYLVFLKSQAEVKNLWQLDVNTHQEQQLTFGTVAAALVSGNRLYWQYLNEPGLWTWDNNQTAPKLINANLPANIKLLDVDNDNIYFITGGYCRESDVLSTPLKGGATSVYLPHITSLTSTTSFHKSRGILQTKCYIPEANIVTLF